MKIIGYRSLSSLIFIAALICASNTLAQSGEPSQPKAKAEAVTEPSSEQGESTKKSPSEKLADDEPAAVTGETKKLSEAEQQSLRRESQSEDEAEPLHYMNNWFKTYRLGPEDVITVDVFGMPQYTRSGIIVPPDGKISYPLIGHIKVVGRTTEDTEKELTERLAEYIIEPKVSVQLVNARSQKIIVDGDVGKPGVYEMTRRMTVQEALAMA
ncbi:MAG TPA: polysaccharide biosynthesis/export family protein, partial [Blastocatellia bacterium]|nr:polysaccharide biosynthesis/export family protein [Blastocatellia bacterium]